MRALSALLLVVGCAGDPSPTEPQFSDGGPDIPATVGMTYAWSFDGQQALSAPWFSVLGNWRVGGDHVAQAGEFASPDFPRVLVEGIQFTDLTMSVRCSMELGEIDRACGVLFRAVDSENYFITRANALEDNIRLYRVVEGVRHTIASTDRDISGSTWHTLGIEATGNSIVVKWNGDAVIHATDDAFTTGVVGLWTKADSITRFDDLTVLAR